MRFLLGVLGERFFLLSISVSPYNRYPTVNLRLNLYPSSCVIFVNLLSCVRQEFLHLSSMLIIQFYSRSSETWFWNFFHPFCQTEGNQCIVFLLGGSPLYWVSSYVSDHLDDAFGSFCWRFSVLVRMTVLGGTKGSPYDCFIEVRGPMARVSVVLFSNRDWKSPAAMVLYLVSQSSYRLSFFFRMSPVRDCRKIFFRFPWFPMRW